MHIKLNEKELQVSEGTTVQDLWRQYKPEADVIIYNGAAVNQDYPLQEGDRVVLIKRGEQPKAEELEILLTSRHTPGVHEKLKSASVGIAGAGGLGSVVATALARVGIGKLVIVDFDLVEPSNLNRQQYFIDQIGMSKVDALKENIRRINPYVCVETYKEKVNEENFTQIFELVDIIVEAFDQPEAKRMLVNTAAKNCPDKPMILASGLAGYGSNNSIKTIHLYNKVYMVGDGVSESRPGQGLMAPRVGIAASQQANAVIRILLDQNPAD